MVVNGVSKEEFEKFKGRMMAFRILVRARFASEDQAKKEENEEETESAKDNSEQSDKSDAKEESQPKDEEEESSSEEEQTNIGMKAFKELTKEVQQIRRQCDRLRNKINEAGLGGQDPSRDLLAEVANASENENQKLLNAKAR